MRRSITACLPVAAPISQWILCFARAWRRTWQWRGEAGRSSGQVVGRPRRTASPRGLVSARCAAQMSWSAYEASLWRRGYGVSDEAIAAWRAPPGMDAPMKVKGSIERSAGTSVDVLCQKASLPVRRWAHARRRCHPSVLLNRRARRTPIPLSATSTSRRSRNGIGWDGNAPSVMAATPSAQLRCRVI